MQHVIDNMVDGLPEWDFQTVQTPSDLSRSGSAGYPPGDGVGVRVVTVAGKLAYLLTGWGATELPGATYGASVWLAIRLRVVSNPVGGSTDVLHWRKDFLPPAAAVLKVNTAGLLTLNYDDYSQGPITSDPQTLHAGRWNHVLIQHRAASDVGVADGEKRLWVNSERVYEATGLDNCLQLPSALIMAGSLGTGRDGFVMDFDDLVTQSGRPPSPHRQFQMGGCVGAIASAVVPGVVGAGMRRRSFTP